MFLKLKQRLLYEMDIYDAIWGNPPHVAQGNFAEIKKNLRIVMFFFIFLLTLIICNFGCRHHRDKI